MLAYTSDAGNYQAAFRLRPEPIVAVGRAFTLVERHGEFVDLTTALHVRPQTGPVMDASVWTGHDLRLEVPTPVRRKGHYRQGATQVWMRASARLAAVAHADPAWPLAGVAGAG